MKLRVALLAGAGVFVSASAVAQDANLIADAKAFSSAPSASDVSSGTLRSEEW
ncbi:MAG TPA: hypothetical protein VN713_03725 [Sphingomicrobium sp.]|nr:hypothetical protein [Sphingomicrobium sp.]